MKEFHVLRWFAKFRKGDFSLEDNLGTTSSSDDVLRPLEEENTNIFTFFILNKKNVDVLKGYFKE